MATRTEATVVGAVAIRGLETPVAEALDPGRAALLPPSGEQVEITAADQRAVVVEVGGGLRDVLGGRPRAPRRLRRRRDVHVGPRPGADPVAEPARGRRATSSTGRGTSSPLDRARAAQRDPRPRALGRVDGRRARAAPGRDGARAPPAAGLPVLARAQHRVRALGRRPRACGRRRRTSGAMPCPYGSGAHPYLTVGTADRRHRDPARARATRAARRRARHPDRHGVRRRARSYDFRAAAADRRDEARPRVHRPRARRGRARPRRAPTIPTDDEGSRSGSTRATPT